MIGDKGFKIQIRMAYFRQLKIPIDLKFKSVFATLALFSFCAVMDYP